MLVGTADFALAHVTPARDAKRIKVKSQSHLPAQKAGGVKGNRECEIGVVVVPRRARLNAEGAFN